MSVQQVTLAEARAVMYKAGYLPEDIDAKFLDWHSHGRRVLIFTNEDLDHSMLGFTMAMPWDQEEFPPHGPDTELGLGWRYLPSHVVEPTDNEEMGW